MTYEYIQLGFYFCISDEAQLAVAFIAIEFVEN